MDIKLSDVVKAVGGSFEGFEFDAEARITGVSTDSREDLRGKLFVALRGDRFDGHDYIQQAFDNGAVCVLTQKEASELGKAFIRTSDTNAALRELAEYYRGLFDIPAVAVTGSVGKTSTKDMINSILSIRYKTLCTEGNFNNEIGLPLTVFKMEREHECAVFEMGMNHFGELHNLSKIGKPSVCVITNIGYSHIENLGSRDGILKAKTEIFDYMSDGGTVVLNGDDDMLRKIPRDRLNTVYFGLDSANDIRAENIKDKGLDGTSFVLRHGQTGTEINLKSVGKHTVYNALCAAAVGFALGLTAGEVKRGTEAYAGSKMRMNITKTESGLTVINDAYNAGPASVKAAIDVLAGIETRKVLIFGDMLELGDYSPELHREVGLYLAEKAIDKVICVGKLALHTYEAFTEYKSGDAKAYYFADRDSMLESIGKLTESGETVLVKASRAIGLEKTIGHL